MENIPATHRDGDGKMRTLQTAHRILSNRPAEAMNDAIGLAAIVGLILAGFLAPVLI